MIRQAIDIDGYRWKLYAYYAVDSYYTDEIAERLISIGCSGKFLDAAMDSMCNGSLNEGLTFSNIQERKTVMVINLTSSSSEFINSLTHEIYHVVSHICECMGIDMLGEEAGYLIGSIANDIFPKVSQLMCQHCRCDRRTKNSNK